MIENCTIALNGAPAGAIMVGPGASGTLDHCIVAGSTEGGAIACDSNGSIDVSCSDVWNNTGGDWTGGVASQQAINDNISADPLFCASSETGFGLQPTSPCVRGRCGVMGALGVQCPARTRR